MTDTKQYLFELSGNDAATLRAIFAEKVRYEEEFIARSENNPAFDTRLLPIVEHSKEQSGLFSKLYNALRRPI